MNVLEKKIKQFLASVFFENTKRDPLLWVFGEWFGTKANDNSCFFANYICSRNSKIKVVWIADKDADLHFLNKTIRVVERDSKQSVEILKKAGVTIVNQGIMDLNSFQINYASGAVSVNLWHGIPWKHIFYDEFSNKPNMLEKTKEKWNKFFNEARYWLAPSTDLKKILINAKFVHPDDIILAGYPRNSIFYDKESIKVISNSLKRKMGLNIKSKIIAYMPTFRDKGDVVFSFESMSEDQEFIEWLEINDVYIIQKAHFVDQKRYNSSASSVNKHSDHIINNNEIAAFELMASSDMLVTDYSSCFFDYLILDRPIIHFIYDYEKYMKQDRGVYYTADEVCCGDIVRNSSDLKKAIYSNMQEPAKDQVLRKKRRMRFVNYESEGSCEKIYRFIINEEKKKFYHK